jgi:hypothetical protein
MGWNRIGRAWPQPDRAHGLIFDGGIFLASFLLLRYMLSTNINEYADRQVGLWLVIGLISHFLGALLKKEPLQDRMEAFQKRGSKEREQLLGCLAFAHFIFFLVVAAMAMALLGFIDPDASGEFRQFLWVSAAFVVAGIISGTAWLGIRNPSEAHEAVIWWQYQEFAADVLLVLSATILTRFFWTALLLESEPPSFMGFGLRSMVYVSAVSVLFLVFYVPARLLFLAEDYRYPSTWLRLWLVAMLPLLVIVFIP